MGVLCIRESDFKEWSLHVKKAVDVNAQAGGSKESLINTVRTFKDENTGREIRQLTQFEHGASLGYFRMFRQLPDGRILAGAQHDTGYLIAIEPGSGTIELLPYRFGIMKLRERDGHAWFLKTSRPPGEPRKTSIRKSTGRELWQVELPSGQPEKVCDIPDDLPGAIEDITIDGLHLVSCLNEQDLTQTPIPTTKDVDSINRYFARPRHGSIWTFNRETGAIRKIHETDGMCPSHLDTSPRDPTLFRFCHDMPDAQGQRVWTMHMDGTGKTAIRPQAFGEMVTHEFWWSDPDFIGYTYQDRRNDPTLKTHHWAEYSLAKTRFGLSDLSGREIYLSDPLNSYHSHIYRSQDGRLISGEGTDGNSFVGAALFSLTNPRLDMVPLATIHTPYVPFRGQGVDCNFSADGRWLIYADKHDGPDKPHQLFAVRVDL
ncbi:MAG: hypothetical protein A2340_08700 [Lentisphaerae bacterium RIFOXYB12_FULL_60_10]|nr:MAG: hypothetical protein A2269_06045 [Lentisphaerae bacterium RIFOXYA12_FULL_60_10]OGV78284.1 MAG: hypothetical protein A2340_08700 [Lentisphaerae bacterium RIFOXYB12_FULL_60_10]